MNKLMNEIDRNAGDNNFLADFNNTDEEIRFRTIIGWFETQAAETPEKTAVRIRDEEITYRELNDRANYIGKLLLTEGIKKGDIIAVMTGRSIELIIGILGVLKSGAAFLPIDMSNPKDRIKFMLADSQAKGIITGAVQKSTAADFLDLPVYMTEKNLVDKHNTGVDIQPDDLAYIIYTSGTTGTPKGVILYNEGIVNFINWSYKRGNFEADSVVLQKATCSFDASLYEIFLALLSGSCLQLLSEEENDDFGSILKVVKDEKVTHMVMIPTILSALLDYMQDNDMEGCFDNIRRLYIAGEALTIELLDKYRKVTGNGWEYISNLYGPTEGSICATGFHIQELNGSEVIPIGKPIDNVKVYIMNENKLCKPGEEGELCIGGIGVGRGYINREELTKQKFIDDPYIKGGRIYRSGDLAKWDDTGNIYFLGRIDEQVKMNGLRIELGEIRSRMLDVPGIVEAAATVKVTNGSKYLVGYIVSNQDVDEDLIKAKLQENLPNYMIPSRIIKMNRLPITANGKLDQKALPEIEVSVVKEYTAPQTETERDLIHILQGVLTVEGIGTNHDFFELGGDSIKAIRIVSKLRALGYRVDLQTIMRERHVGRIAGKLTKAQYKRKDEPVVGEVALTPIQDYFFNSQLMEPHHFNQTFLLQGEDLQEEYLERSAKALVIHHDMLRAVYCGDRQSIKAAYEKMYELHVRMLSDNLTENEIMEQIGSHESKIQRSMDLAQGPLVKFCLYKSGRRSYVLFAVHHLIVDGISWRILVEDLNIAYEQCVKGEAIHLPEKTASFKTWSCLLQEYAKQPEMELEIRYWNRIEQLIQGKTKTLCEKGKKGKRRCERIRFTEMFTKKLLLESGKAYHTEINDLLVTALFRALAVVTGEKTVTFNLEGHGREEIHVPVAIDRTVGWFTTVYPVVGEDVGKSLEDDIQATKEMLRKIPNKGLGYGVLKANGKLGDYYDGDITFNYLGDFGREADNYRIGIHTVEYGDQVSTKNQFASPISIDCSITEQILEAVISFDETYCNGDMIQKLKEVFKDELEEIVDHCSRCTFSVHTASDYGEITWTNDDFRYVETYYSDKRLKLARILPLTPMQEGMLFENLASQKRTSYVVQTVYSAATSISESIFRESVKLLIEKYSALRTRIVHQNVSEPRQVIVEPEDYEWMQYNLTTVEDAESEFRDICSADIKRGFDLSEDSLFRVKYIQLSEDDIRIVFSFHHIIMDGWCMPILLKDLGIFYEKLMSGMSSCNISASEDSEINPAGLLSSKYTEQGMDFWRELLDDFSVKSEIRPEEMLDLSEEEHAVTTVEIGIVKSNEIADYCRTNGITPNSLFETVWGILLQRLTGTSDVVFGRVVSGRTQDIEGIEKCVGLLINTIPVRIISDGKETVSDLLSRSYEQSVKSMQYDDYPLPVIQNQSALKTELIQSLVAFEVLADEKEISGKLGLERISTREQTNYPITLNITQKDAEFIFQIMYDTSLYGKKECELILDKYEYILGKIMEETDVQVGMLDCVPPEEEQLVITEFNQTETAYPMELSVTDIFEEYAERCPDKIAVRQGADSLTYRQLDRRAREISTALVSAGVRKGDIVGVAAAKEMEVVAGFLGILLSGAVYLPLDINNPAERQEYILKDCKCSCVLDFGGQLNTGNYDGKILRKEDIGSADFSIQISNKPNDLAYIIYTSGTTGEPKGVMIEHRSIVRLVKKTNYISFDDISVLQTGSLTFDACTFEIWGALLNGGTVCIADTEVLADTRLLGEAIDKYGINSMFITVTLFNQIVDLDVKVLGKLKYLLVGGEKMSRGPAEAFRKENPQVKFSNAYGPTECTTFALTELLDTDISAIIPIGRPISNTTAYVLREGNQLCGVGMPGELCLGGPGVARGYLGLEKLTNEKFIENPYVQGEKIYRTGDFARWLSNGSVDCLGRMDDQVKIRGFRIELGEIGNVIKDMQEVSDAAIVVQEREDEKILCAYIQLSADIDIQEIKEHLSKRLPHYMIPTYIMTLPKLPVNKNGKLDKNALPLPDFTQENVYTEPRTETEKQLRNIFEDILQVDEIGIDDDFFALGGHSIKIIRLAGMIEKTFGIRLAVSDLMKKKTIREIAEQLSAENLKSEFKAIPKSDNYELSSVQKRIYALEQLSEGTVAYNVPVLLKVEGDFDITRLRTAICQLCNRHEILRTSFGQEEDKQVQIVHSDVDIPVEVIEYDVTDIREIIPELVKPFSLGELPLLRAYKLLNQYDNSIWLFFDIHHIIFDGASTPFFLSELCRLYSDEPVEELFLQYKDYSAWHNEMDKTEQEKYWLDRLGGEEFHTHLREDFARSMTQTYHGECISSMVGDGLYQKIREYGRQEGATDYMVFLAAVSVLLSRCCRQEKVFIGTAVSGRSHADIQEMLGMFVNTVVIKNEVTSEMRFEELLRNTKKICSEAFEHQDYPFEVLVEKLGVERSSSRNPIFDVLFTLEMEDGQTYVMDGSKLISYEIPNYTAKFDLVINVKLSLSGCRIAWEYNKSLFKQETIKRMAAHLTAILEQCMKKPEVKLNCIQNMDHDEWKLITGSFAMGERSDKDENSLLDVFEEQVRRNPDKVAVRIGSQQMTYTELSEKANGLGRKLQEYRVGRNDMVALMTGRSMEMLVGIIGVLKAGAAYVPIDPDYPEERVRFILEDSGAKVLLVHGTNREVNLPSIQYKMNLSDVKAEKVEPEGIAVGADIAYVIYTSGTTGTPKGVPIQRQSLMNLMNWQIKEAEVTESSVVLQKSTYMFDASVWEIFLGLLSGATLQMLTEEENEDYHRILEVIERGQVTHTLMIPTVFDTLLDYAEEGSRALASIKRLYLGAETLQYELIDKYVRTTGNDLTNVRNLYGPTEGTVCATCHKLTEQDAAAKIPIGKPIDGVDILIMQDGLLCGIGMVGEICIGGAGISAGYLNRDELTEEKFVQSPLESDKRIYRTGDLAAWREDGSIEYVGRIDDQVKIRGFRVELDEINTRCAKIRGVHNSATIIYETDKNQYICCYVVADENLNVKKIKRELRASLPDYMIPSYIGAVEKLPMTQNGKLDRKALPAPQLSEEEAYVAPVGETESALAEIFSEILGVERVGSSDSFFALGGHSIKAANLVRMIEKKMGTRLSVKDIMVHQDIHHIAEVIKEKGKEKKYVPLVKATGI